MHPILAAREKQGDTYYKDPALGRSLTAARTGEFRRAGAGASQKGAVEEDSLRVSQASSGKSRGQLTAATAPSGAEAGGRLVLKGSKLSKSSTTAGPGVGVVKRSRESLWVPVCRLSKKRIGTSSPLPSLSPRQMRLSWEVKTPTVRHVKAALTFTGTACRDVLQRPGQIPAYPTLRLMPELSVTLKCCLSPVQYTWKALDILRPLYPQTSLRQPDGDEPLHCTGEENETDTVTSLGSPKRGYG